MILQIYNGKNRGFGGTEEGGWVKLGFEFREYMHHFKGAKLSVLLCLILHSDEDGRCWPSYATISEETGLNPDTISIALNELCEMTIEGQRVLLRYNHSTHIPLGSNHYIVFPSSKEIHQYEKARTTVIPIGKSDIPISENPIPPIGKSDSKKNQLSKTTDSINLRESFKQKKKKSKVQIDPDFQDYLNHRGL